MTEKTSCGRKTKTAVKGSEGAERAGGAELSLRLVLECWSQSCSALCGEGLCPHHELLLLWRQELISCWFHSSLCLDMSREMLGRLEPVSHGI